MLDPEYLAQLPEPILRLWRKAEQQILADMARRISTYDYWIPAADHQSARLRAAGHTQEEILAALAPVTRKSEAELRQMMTDAGSRCLADDAELYHAAGLDVPDPAKHSGLTATLNTGYRQTAQTMENLTRTTAQTATQQFENALDRAWLQINSGAFDYDAAIRGTIKGLSEAGVSAIRYPSGRVDSIETAIRRAVLTGVNQTAGKLQMELADEVGCDLVEVTAHAGARPSHALWQGKIYSRSGKSKKYPDFVSSTGYGTGAGLCGWNCRHSFGPYIEGSPRVWTDEKLAELNEPKYEYNGEKLTEYEAQQKENYFNRQIQRWNREAEAMKAAGQDPSEARSKAREWRARKKDFLENRTDLRLAEREREKQWGVRYGTDAITADREYILSDAYAQKFNGLTGRPSVDQSICDHARKAVLENSDTLYESMYLLDAETGETIVSIDNPSDKMERGVAYTPEFRKALKDAKERNRAVIAIHNHPEGTPPSVEDYNKALDNGYIFGLACGANGQVYRYYPPSKIIPNAELLHNEIVWQISQGTDIDRAHRNVLKYYQADYDILEGR